MSFEPPDGILDIGNATLRVGKLEVAETSGLNQGLQNIIKNDLLITENNESSPYTTNQKWGIKLPTTWVAEFEVKGQSGKYIDFNFYNENSASNALGYNLTFKDTSLTLRYDGGNNLPITGDTVDSTLSLGDAGYGVATIPTIVGAYRKVNIFFERGVISVSIDGTRYLYFKESDGYNQGLGVASRVVSTTGSAFVNVFIESDNENNSKFKNLRIVNGRFISDKTSNIAFIGGNLGVGVNSPKETLDIRGNMHLTRVSNVSQISVDSNVVTEYTGPHDRPLRKYPEVAMTSASQSGYVVTAHTEGVGSEAMWKAFDGDSSSTYWKVDNGYSTSSPYSAVAISGVLPSFTDTAGTPHAGHWIQLELPHKIKLTRFVTAANFASQYFMKSYVVLGSNDNTSWTLLHSEANGTGVQDVTTLSGGSTSRFKYFKLIVKAKLNGSSAHLQIGEIKFYSREEGDSSIDTTFKSVYNVPATTGTQLEVYYDAKGESTVQSPIPDLSPNTNTGAVSGHSPTLDSTDGIDSFKFNGSSQYVTGAHGLTTGSGPVHTISLWLNAVETTDLDYVVQLGQGGTSHQQSAIIFKDNKISHAHWSSGVLSDVTIATNVWYHVVAVFTGGNGSDLSKHKIFINGEDGGVGPFPGSTDGPVVLTGTQLTLGRNNNQGGSPGSYFNGSIANFRLYSKALNAGEVQELYDYQKDYFLGSKSQVTLYKGHLGVGVTEPSGQLELAGDERIQEYPPRALTGYQTLVEGHGMFCVSQSSLRSGHQGWYAFEKTNTGTFKYASDVGGGDTFGGTDTAYNGSNRLSSSTPLGAWLKIELPYKIRLQHTSIAASGSTEQAEDFGIYGSNDDNTWDQLFQKTGATATSDYVDYVINATSRYKYFAILVTKLISSTTILAIEEWKLFGTPGPTTLDKGSLTLGRSLDVPRISRYDVDTETPRPEKLVLDYDTTIHPSHGQIASDRSGRGNDAFAQNQAIYSAADKAYKFDGSADVLYCNIPTGNSWGGSGTGLPTGDAIYTVSCWVKTAPTQTVTHPCILYFGSAWTTSQLAGVYLHDGNKLGHDIGSTGVYTTNQVITAENWHHVVVVKRGTGDIGANTTYQGLFVDGVEIAQLTINGSPRTQALGAIDHITIGGSFYGSMGSFSDGLNGLISKPQIWNVALENSEVKKLYNLGRTGRSMILADTSLQIGAGNHSSIFGGPTATLDVHGSAHVSGKFHSMEGNFHRMLGFARGGGHIDHHRTDNCLVAMAGATVVNSGHVYVSFVLRKSGNWMPFFVEVYHCGVNTNSSSLFERRAWVHGRIFGTAVDHYNHGDGVSMSASDLGGDLVRFRIFINREGRSYGVSMVKMSYYYGIKGRMD